MSAARSAGELLRRHDERALYIARVAVSEFVVEQSEKVRAEVGFGYEPVEDAPATFAALQAAYARSAGTGEPLPVSAAHSESVIYGEPEVNYALRFWHDVQHVRLRLTFELADELELALWHLGVLEREGFAPESLAWKLLHADLMGSVYVMSLARRFPLDQRRFAEGCVAGFDREVLRELRRQA